MRKRLSAILLAGVLLALSACGNVVMEETKEIENTVTEESQSEEIASTESGGEEVTETEADSFEQTQVNQESEAEDSYEEADEDSVQLMFDWSDENKEFRVDLNEDGKEDTIELTIDYSDEYTLAVNGVEYVLYKYPFYFSKAFLVKKDDKYFVYMQLKYNGSIGRRSIEIFELKKNAVHYVGSFSGQLMEFEDPDSFIIRSYLDETLVEMNCYVGDGGMPDFVSDRYKLIQYDEKRTYDYVSLVDIQAKLVDEQGDLLGSTYNFPAGTEFVLMYTDLMTYYDVKTDDGRYSRHYIEEVQDNGEYYLTINGLAIDSCMEEFPKEQESKDINAEDMFGESMEEAYQEKFRQLLPYVSDDKPVCGLTGEIVQCCVTRKKIINPWISLGEIEFVVENVAEQFHHGNLAYPEVRLEQDIKQALGKEVGEEFVIDYKWPEIYDETYRYTILDIKKNKELGNDKETVEYGDTIRAICDKTENTGYFNEFVGNLLLQVDQGVAKLLESDYPFSERMVEKIEKEGGMLKLYSGVVYEYDSDHFVARFDVYDEEYAYNITVTAVTREEAFPAFEIPAGWGYQFDVSKIGSFKEYTEDSPCTPVDMEGGEWFGYEDRLDAGCSTWCGCESYYCEATASSSLPDQGTQTYGAENLIYTSRMNAWAEGVPGNGIGESIEIREMYQGIGDEVFRYNEMCIVNGYAKDETTWLKNNRVKSMKLYFMDEYMGTITLEDTMLPQYIDLSAVAMKVGNGCEAKFRFEIADVYKGTKYDDTCISGIVVEFEGRDAH